MEAVLTKAAGGVEAILDKAAGRVEDFPGPVVSRNAAVLEKDGAFATLVEDPEASGGRKS